MASVIDKLEGLKVLPYKTLNDPNPPDFTMNDFNESLEKKDNSLSSSFTNTNNRTNSLKNYVKSQFITPKKISKKSLVIHRDKTDNSVRSQQKKHSPGVLNYLKSEIPILNTSPSTSAIKRKLQKDTNIEMVDLSHEKNCLNDDQKKLTGMSKFFVVGEFLEI